MQKQCQDGFYTTFSSYRKMLDYHQEQSMNSRWIKSKVSDLEIQPLGKGSALSADLSAFAAGTTQDAVDDTADNLGLAMRVNGELFPMRMTADRKSVV